MPSKFGRQKIKSLGTSGLANTGLLTEAQGPNDPHVTGPQQLQGRRQQSEAVLTTISGRALITQGVPESSLLTREITGPLRLKAGGFVNLTPVPALFFPPSAVFYDARWTPALNTEVFTAE